MRATSIPRRARAAAGFTLIELLVVLGIVALLCTLATPRYFQSIGQSKEAVLVHNLQTTRETIDKFYADTGRYPDSLEELVERRYLRGLPFDPVTESSAWQLIAPDSADDGGVYDLRSAAPGTMHDGTPYSEL